LRKRPSRPAANASREGAPSAASELTVIWTVNTDPAVATDSEPRFAAHSGRARARAIAKLAARQRGLVTRAQLLEIGLTRHAIDNWVRSRRLHALYRGVYLVGHPEPIAGARELGAILACGAGAVVSHRSASGLWRLLPDPGGDVDVTLAGRHCGPKRGIRVHRLAALDRRDVRKLGGIPVTSPARTILDLAGVVSPRDLERALAEAQARRLVRRADLLSLLARRSGRPGAAALRRLIEGDAPALTQSEAEERFLALIRAAELPTPEVNARIGDTRSTSCGVSVPSSSKSTATGFTPHGPRSSATAGAMRI
jgi:hypothetical protein